MRRRLIAASNPYGLPPGYRHVEHITTSGSAYIATAYVPTVGDEFAVDFVTNDSLSSTRCLFSAGTGTRQLVALAGQYDGRKLFYCRCFSQSAATLYCTLDSGTKYRLTANANGVYTCDGASATNAPIGELDGTSTNLWIFKRRNASSPWIGKLYSFTVQHGGITKLNLVPCVRISDSKAGAYDTVSKTFYPSASDTDFTTD